MLVFLVVNLIHGVG